MQSEGRAIPAVTSRIFLSYRNPTAGAESMDVPGCESSEEGARPSSDFDRMIGRGSVDDEQHRAFEKVLEFGQELRGFRAIGHPVIG